MVPQTLGTLGGLRIQVAGPAVRPSAVAPEALVAAFELA
jgi:hypothetical protein